MYPAINEFIDLLHSKQISSFLVTNAQFPDAIRTLKPVTQLYVSVDAATKDSLKKIDRPLFKDFWERFLESLKELKMSCGCSKSTILFLLVHCPGLTTLVLGSSTELCNQTITEVLSLNSLTHLEELEISSGEHLDRETIDILLSSCANLRKIKGTQYWKGISQAEKERLKNFIRINNLDLDIAGLVTQDMTPFTYKVELSEEQKRFLSTA